MNVCGLERDVRPLNIFFRIHYRLSMTLILRSILGLTSSDDDYVPPNPEDEIQLLAKLKSEGADTEVSKFMISLIFHVSSAFVVASNIKIRLNENK